MRSILAVATAVSLLAPSASLAADLGPKVDAYHLQQPYATGPALRQFYVRGDIGIGRHDVGAFSQADLSDNGGTFISKSVGDTTTIGAGLGWQLNNRLRFDLTGEYRASASVKALDHLAVSLTGPDGTLIANTQYQGDMSAVVGLANGYWDLGTWRGITPYVGGGIGFARMQLSGFTTLSTATFTDAATGAITTQVSPGTGEDKTQINLAWALMAGLSFDIGSHAKLDLGYRYLNMGSDIAAVTGLLNCVCGTVGQPLKIGDLDAHEFRIGLRVPLGAEPLQAGYRSLK